LLVGAAVGVVDVVGFSVGDVVGFSVGDVVGFSVGDIVGLSVGEIVGLLVGGEVCGGQPPNNVQLTHCASGEQHVIAEKPVASQKLNVSELH
jgi:hypothetical protein